MQDKKTLEKELNSLKDMKDSIELIKANINILEFALSGCEEKEKDILTRICINREPIENVAQDYGIKLKQMYNLKNKSLETLLRRLNGK